MNDSGVRNRIVEAATHLFAHKGYGSTSVREVVEAAGVTKPTLYYYFQNKERLFVDTVNTHIAWFTRQLDGAASSEGSPEDRLHAFLDVYLGGVLENEDGARLLMTVKMPGEPGADKQPEVDLMTLHRRTMELVSGLIQECITSGALRADVDVRDAAFALIGAAHMHLMSWMHGQSIQPDYRNRILNLFYAGVKP